MDNYSIVDLKGFAVSIRSGAAKSFSEDYSENLDEFISINQVINVIKQNSLGQDDEEYYVINELIFDDIFNEIRNWLYEVGLAKLAAKGYVDCAWDNESNSMTFWLPNKDKTHISSKPSDS
jgi:hypothetical protein